MIGRDKSKAFSAIKERVGSKLHRWKEKLLSQAGKEVLLKVVAQSIPTIAMSCFLLPKGCCSELNKMMSNFLWGQRGSKHKMHWMGWKKMCKEKNLCGIGFRDLHLFNLALLAKQGWKLLTGQSCLLFRVLKARYFPISTFLNAKLSSNASYTWRSIRRTREVLQLGFRWKIGNGS